MSFSILSSASKRSKNAIRGSRTSAKTKLKVDELKILEYIDYYWRIIFPYWFFSIEWWLFLAISCFLFNFQFTVFFVVFFCLAKKGEGNMAPWHPRWCGPCKHSSLRNDRWTRFIVLISICPFIGSQWGLITSDIVT